SLHPAPTLFRLFSSIPPLLSPPLPPTLFPYTTLFRSDRSHREHGCRGSPWHPCCRRPSVATPAESLVLLSSHRFSSRPRERAGRSEEHTSELQSRFDLVCRLLLEKKKTLKTPLIPSDY